MPWTSRAPKRRACREHFGHRFEMLEDRLLLSPIAKGLASAPAEKVSVHIPNDYVTTQTSEVDVTVTRSIPNSRSVPKDALTVNVSTPQAVSQTDMSFGYSDMTDPSIPPSATPGVQYIPLNKNVTFQPGQTSLTIPLQLIPNAPNSGVAQIFLFANNPRQSIFASLLPGEATLNIVTGPDQIPPSIIKAQVKQQGIILTFNKPMAPGPVQNVHNYIVTANLPVSTAHLIGVFLTGRYPNPPVVALKAATYDPATDTVTLVPKKALSASNYNVASPGVLGTLRLQRRNPDNIQPLTDTNGREIGDDGSASGNFNITVGRIPWTPPNPEAVVS
jgi:hypothetical protein